MVKLPPEISVDKRRHPKGGWAFYFRHCTLGELGRIVAQDVPGAQCLISCELVGDPADPMTAQRAAIFQPIGLEITSALEANLGRGPGRFMAPPESNEPVLTLENKLLQCPHCGAAVGRLVFAPQATDQGLFEDHARMLFPTFAEFDVPTWIIGPDLTDGPEETRPADIMQVWPVREPIRRLSPSLFNPELNRLQKQHCKFGAKISRTKNR